jgi:hypothetical protein
VVVRDNPAHQQSSATIEIADITDMFDLVLINNHCSDQHITAPMASDLL